MNNKRIRVVLPGARVLIASDRCDPEYPGIDIRIIEPDDESGGYGDVIAWVEYSPNDTTGAGVYVRAYARDDDEPSYSEPYCLDKTGKEPEHERRNY